MRHKIISFFVLFGLAWSGWAIEQQKVFDVHFHAYPRGEVMPKLEPVSGLLAPDTTEELYEENLSYLKRHNVVKAVANGPLFSDYKRALPNVFMKGCGFMGSEDIETFRKKIIGEQCQVMAESAPQYGGLNPGSEELYPFYALAEELGIPVGIHVGLGPPGAAYMGMTKYRMADSNPLALEDALIEYPDMKLYVMHAGWPMLDEMIGLLYAHPQVYVDISVINWVLPRAEFYHYLKRLVQAGFSKRIMYGSDQMVWPKSYEVSLAAIDEAPFLSEQQKDDILFYNAVRFFDIDKQDGGR